MLGIAGLGAASAVGLDWVVGAGAAQAGVADVARDILRPELTPLDAVVILMDARSTLREISGIAATPKDSQERFDARKLWPAFAKRLREVGPAAPVVVALTSGTTDSEATLSQLYGGSAGAQPGPADRVYQSIGGVLTLSGRTIQPLAQRSPEAADEARAAIEEFLSKVPKDIVDAATEFRVARAEAARGA